MLEQGLGEGSCPRKLRVVVWYRHFGAAVLLVPILQSIQLLISVHVLC